MGFTMLSLYESTTSPNPVFLVNGCITGVSFQDCDCDGIRDPGEPLFSGMAVEVYDCQNALVGTSMTDAEAIGQFVD